VRTKEKQWARSASNPATEQGKTDKIPEKALQKRVLESAPSLFIGLFPHFSEIAFRKTGESLPVK
jgi:hypothetical protein